MNIPRSGLTHSALFAVLLLACVTGAGWAQVLKLRSCKEPKVPIGRMDASGVVRFQIGQDGRPLAGTIATLKANGATPVGLQSAAERQLTACRFDTRHLERRYPVTAEANIRFDSLQAWFSDPVITVDQRRPDPVPLGANVGPGSFSARLAIVDERPRGVHCNAAMQPQYFPSGQSMQEVYNTLQLTGNFGRGVALVRFIVRDDGRVDKKSIEVLAASASVMRKRIVLSLAKCRFAPGRVAGRPATVIVTQQIWLP